MAAASIAPAGRSNATRGATRNARSARDANARGGTAARDSTDGHPREPSGPRARPATGEHARGVWRCGGYWRARPRRARLRQLVQTTKNGFVPPRDRDVAEGVFPGEKKTNRLWHISLRFFTFFPLNHEPKKSPDARTTARETETSHDATRTAPSLFSFVFVIGVFREDHD
jgi:hypothetical protein